ncbi:MAG: DNA replication/repair protein RecF [Pseudomonadota bacterium]
MAFSVLNVSDFRNLSSIQLQPGSGMNLILGENAAGKTSILEALYYLGRGRSFRTSDARKLISQGKDCFELFAKIEKATSHSVGVRRARHGLDLRVDGRTTNRFSDIARYFPVQLITPRSHELLERGPDFRRRFLDWGVFHVEHQFNLTVARYKRALRQRNHALHTGGEVEPWEGILADLGERIDLSRSRFLKLLEKEARGFHDVLGAADGLAMSYQSGWPRELSLGQALEKKRDVDRKRQFTSVGPHRADIQIRSSGKKASDWLSRGQQKILVFALSLAQAEVIGAAGDQRVTLLVDDFAAELDADHRQLVVSVLSRSGNQVLMTALDNAGVPPGSWDRVFHVEHGSLT